MLFLGCRLRVIGSPRGLPGAFAWSTRECECWCFCCCAARACGGGCKERDVGQTEGACGCRWLNAGGKVRGNGGWSGQERCGSSKQASMESSGQSRECGPGWWLRPRLPRRLCDLFLGRKLRYVALFFRAGYETLFSHEPRDDAGRRL